MSSTVLHPAAGLAPASHLLAGWWSRPTEEEVEGWTVWTDADELREAFEASVHAALLEEYERLLVGPGRAPCPPYESLWRGDGPRRERGRLMGECSGEVSRIYGVLGLRAKPSELPDHIAVELEALAFALEHGNDEAAQELARAHLALWVPCFCAAIEDATQQPFYRALARLTPEWVAAFAA